MKWNVVGILKTTLDFIYPNDCRLTAIIFLYKNQNIQFLHRFLKLLFFTNIKIIEFCRVFEKVYLKRSYQV